MNKQETKQCQNCKSNFTIEPDDFSFYEKIAVPPPTFCPECRIKRRMMFMNERTLFRVKDGKSGKEILSIFPPSALFPVYEHSFWWSDEWDPLDYGMEYDFSKPFFEQLKSLFDRVPRYNMTNVSSVNCSYCPRILHSKNSYQVVGWGAQECMYGHFTRDVKNSQDYFFLISSENCYECVYCVKSYNLLYSAFSRECMNSYFLYDCLNCQDCFGCIGLRNKKYYIFNIPHTKEEYEEKVEKYRTQVSTRQGREELYKKVKKHFLAFPRRYARVHHSHNVTGDNLTHCKDSFECFDIDAMQSVTENCKRIIIGTATRDSHDLIEVGEGAELCYEGVTVSGARNLFSHIAVECQDVAYSYNCHNCRYLFGCNGLRNKKYCIFNKQYTQEEYEALIPQIKKHMADMPYIDEKGCTYQYGEFFPVDLSPFGYNQSTAQEYFPHSEEQARQSGYVWSTQPQKRNYVVTMSEDDFPSSIGDVPDSITSEIIACSHKGECVHQCTTAFRITSHELAFYRTHNIPLPNMCPNCRHYARLAWRNPLTLWHRQCACTKEGHDHDGQCPNEFETSYAPDRPEIVYCEECYKSEVV